MAYLKYGVATKIEVITNNKTTNKFIKDNFNLALYIKKSKHYFLKSEILNKNIKSFRKEVLSYTDGKSDSINNCEAYCLYTNADDLLEDDIVFASDNEKYSFSCNNHKFETDIGYICNDHIKIKIYIIPILWDINKVEFENNINLSLFTNKLIKNTLQNILKDASFLIVV